MAGNDNKLVTLADLGAAYTALSATATTSANGMMSSTDKTKLESIPCGISDSGKVYMKSITADHIYAITGCYVGNV